MLGASAHASEEIVNNPIPHWKTRRRPKRSDSEPALRTTVASASVYASTTHCTPVRPAWRSRAMCGSAVFTTAMSSINIAVARQTTARVPGLLNILVSFGSSRSGQVVEQRRRTEDLDAVLREQARHLRQRRHDRVRRRLGAGDGDAE